MKALLYAPFHWLIASRCARIPVDCKGGPMTKLVALLVTILLLTLADADRDSDDTTYTAANSVPNSDGSAHGNADS